MNIPVQYSFLNQFFTICFCYSVQILWYSILYQPYLPAVPEVQNLNAVIITLWALSCENIFWDNHLSRKWNVTYSVLYLLTTDKEIDVCLFYIINNVWLFIQLVEICSQKWYTVQQIYWFDNLDQSLFYPLRFHIIKKSKLGHGPISIFWCMFLVLIVHYSSVQ